MIRKYLVDRHERSKDTDYRSKAEAERLALDNALRRLDVVERVARLEQDYGPDIYVGDAWRIGWLGEIRPALQQLGELDERGLIDGSTAVTGREPLEPRELPPAEPE